MLNNFFKYLLIASYISACNVLLAQQVVLEGEADYLIKDSRLMQQYEYEVRMQAINNALYESFGSSVTSNYESLSHTEFEGTSLKEHSQNRNQYINTFPNGIWKKDIKDPVYETYKDEKGNWWIHCKVVGYGEEIKSSPVSFVVKTLDGTDIIKDRSEYFISGERGYLYFRSSQEGYLSIYYDDFNKVQRCLPYNHMETGHIEIKPNTDYLFFSSKHSPNNIASEQVDEIEFFTEKQIEYNQFYIIFSPLKISQPILEKPDETSSFRTLDRKTFHKWLQDIRLKNDHVQIEIVGVTIKQPE